MSPIKVQGRLMAIGGGEDKTEECRILKEFSREGTDVVVSYLNEEDAAETERVVEDVGRECPLIAGDIGDESANFRQGELF